jgi:hypothetical protein
MRTLSRRGVLRHVVLLCPLTAAATLSSCGRTVETIVRCPSPDGKRDAVFYWIHGGGAAGWAIFRITVVSSGASIDPDAYLFEMTRAFDASVSWKDSNTLAIAYPNSARVARRDVTSARLAPVVPGIQLSYLALPTIGSGGLEGGARCK